MGKANRIKSDRPVGVSSNVSKKKDDKRKERNKSRLYTAIMAVVALFVVAVIAVSFITSSGIIGRNTKAIYSDNYTINENMLKYMYYAECDSFYNNYSYYLTSFGFEFNEDSPSFLEQVETKEISESVASQLGTQEKTWKGYMMSLVKSNAEQMLTFCEIALDKDVKLSDYDNKVIDEAIHEIEHQGADLGYANMDSYLEAMYGKGIKAKDVRAALELSMLSSKAAETVDAEIMGAITKEEIEAKYGENSKNYNVKDYIFYTMSVEYDDVAADTLEKYDPAAALSDEDAAKVLEAYKTKIDETRRKAEGFENYTTLEDFKAAVIDDLAKLYFDALYETEALADADKFDDGILSVIKKAMIAQTIAEIESGAEASAATEKVGDAFTAYGETITENAAKAVDNIKTKLHSNLSSAKESFFGQNIKYSASDDVAKWAFDSTTKIGDTKKLSYGDGADDADLNEMNEAKSGYFDISVVMLASDEYADTELAKNLSYVTFESQDAAKAAVEAFKSGATKDLAAFEALLNSDGAETSGKFENYLQGQFTNTSFETWLYDEKTVVGSITETPISTGSTTDPEYALFFYYSEGEENWVIDVKNAIFVEKYQQYTSTIEGKYTVTVVDEVISKI